MSIEVVTVATGRKAYFDYFMKSCERFNIEPKVLGFGKKWTGFRMKFELLGEYLTTVDDEKLILFVDSYDLVLTEDPRLLIDKYGQIKKNNGGKDIIIGSSDSSKSMMDIFVSILFGKCNGSYMNTGTVLAPAKMLKEAVGVICKGGCPVDTDDQRSLIKYCQDHGDLFKVDDFDLFAVYKPFGSNNNKLLTFKDEKLIHTENETPFFVLHMHSNQNMDFNLEKLGYNVEVDGTTERDKWQYYFKQTKHHMNFLLKKYMYFIIVLVVIITLLSTYSTAKAIL